MVLQEQQNSCHYVLFIVLLVVEYFSLYDFSTLVNYLNIEVYLDLGSYNKMVTGEYICPV